MKNAWATGLMVLATLCWGAVLQARVLTVAQSGGTYSTIQAGANAAMAGDTVSVKAGTYNESVTPGNSGTAAKYITYMRYGNDNVVITGGGFSIAQNYIVVQGFEISTSGGIVVNGSYCRILDNYIHNVTYYGINIKGTYNLCRNNKVNSGGADFDNVLIEGSNNIFEYNEVSDLANQSEDFLKFTGNNNVIRHNYFHDLANNGKHNDAFQCGGANTDNVLISDNIVAGVTGQLSMLSPWGGATLQNIAYVKNVMWMLPDQGGWGLNVDQVAGVRVINNTFGPIYWGAVVMQNSSGTVVNNLFYNSSNNGSNSPYSGTNVIGDYNLIYPIPPYAPQPQPHEIWGQDPKCVDAINYNFHLQSNSPAIDAGTYMTKTTGAGTGTQIPVADARLFTDGRGIADGDSIQLQGQTKIAKITSIDYVNNILTVDQSLTWTNGLGVSRPYYGSAPDMGAYEYSNVEVRPSTGSGANDRIKENSALNIFPNPMRAALLNQYLQSQKDLKAYDLAGNPISKNLIINEGIYLLQSNINDILQKVTIIK